MGAVASEVAQRHGRIVGFVPDFLRVREQADELPGQRLVLTPDLLERKRGMIEQADGFIALPGGYGTLDEVLEVASMKALGILTAPLVLVNVDEAWTPFVTLIDSLYQRRFLQDRQIFTVVRDPESALARIEAYGEAERSESRPTVLHR